MGTNLFSVTSFAPKDPGDHRGDVLQDEVHNLTTGNAPQLGRKLTNLGFGRLSRYFLRSSSLLVRAQ